MAIKYIFTISVILVLQAETVKGQTCYFRLADASGVNTDSYQQDLEAAACALRAVFPAEFQESFKVFDLGFYLHHPVTTGYPQVFEIAKSNIASTSPYYLLFGKQTDPTGVYTRFWVDLKLPTTGKFGCIDLLSPTLRGDIKHKIEHLTATIYAQDGNQFSQYANAEKASMAALQKIVVELVECCILRPTNTESTNSCNAFLFPAELKEVTYSGEPYIEMKQDGDNNFGLPFPKPHFLSSRPTNTPQSSLACVSGLDIMATTVFDGNEAFETIMVRGKGDTQVNGTNITVNFAERMATQDAVTQQITTILTGKLPNMAVFLDDFIVKWEMKVKKAGEPEGDWEPVGESVNDWYLTLKQPKQSDLASGYDYYQTLFDIGCKYGTGASDLELINGVWEHFKGKSIARSDGQLLAYYKTWVFPPNTFSVQTNDLLQYKEGQCNAWSKFFLDVLKVQGYIEDGFLLVIKADPTNSNRQAGGFVLGNWDFKTGIHIGEPDYDYWNIYNNDNKYTQSSDGQWKHVWWQNSTVPLPQVTQMGYIPAQNNNSNSLSYFGHHIIVKIQVGSVEKYLDPSYGVEYGNLDEMDENIAGFWLELPNYSLPLFVTPQPSSGYNDLVLFRKNTPEEKLKIDGAYKY